MKISPANADRFTSQPDPLARAILVYGPDGGLVRERAKKLGLSVVNDLTDPFLVGEISGAKLQSDPALLADEAMAISMIGGRRIVRISDCTDDEAGLFEAFLKDSPGDALIICIAGDLKKNSKLKKAFESAKNAAAIGCYADNLHGLAQMIHSKMKEANIKIDQNAVDFLASQLGSDRGVSAQEISKLILYIGKGNQATLDDILASMGDIAVYSMDKIIYAAADGDSKALDAALEKAWAEGTSPVPILRMTGNHLLRLQFVATKTSEGMNVKIAMKSLRPPVFFKMEQRFCAQLRWWPKAIALALPLLLKAEADCKKTNMPDLLIAGRCLQHIAAIARKIRQR